MNFFYHKNLGNHLLQLCPKVVKHSVYHTGRVRRVAELEHTAQNAKQLDLGKFITRLEIPINTNEPIS